MKIYGNFKEAGRETSGGLSFVLFANEFGEDWNADVIPKLGKYEGPLTTETTHRWLVAVKAEPQPNTPLHEVQLVVSDPTRMVPPNRIVVGYDREVEPKNMDFLNLSTGEIVPRSQVIPAEITQESRILTKADLWRRTTDEEAEAIYGAMQGQPSIRLRMLFESAQFYSPSDELWPTLMGAAVQLFGKTRAEQLLAPSDLYFPEN